MAKIDAYYFIGAPTIYTKVYDGTKLQADTLRYSGYLDEDSLQTMITRGNIKHVNQYGTMVYDETLGKYKGTLDLHFDEGYPKVFRDGVDVTDEYNQTQVADATFTDLTPGYKTFTIIARDITLQSADLTKEYDGTALTAYSQQGGTDVQDLTAGQTDKGYVSGEEFEYSFTGSQLFVGSTDNTFDVSDSDTALTTDYNVTKKYGTLTVTGRTAPLTITVKDQTKTYDGTATIDTTSAAYTVTGDLAYGDTITVTLSNSNINAGTYKDGITAKYTIMHNNGDGTYTDVSDMYLNVTVDNGDLTVNKRDVTITSATDSKVYDGTALTNHDTSVTSGSFVKGEGYVANVTGSQTEVGTSKNIFSVSAAAGTNIYNYNVTKIEGTLTVEGWGDVTITADSDTKMYDGTALTDSGYTVTGLVTGHTITVTTAGSITHYGTTANTVIEYTIRDASGNDVTTGYNSITTVDGELSITKRDVTLTSDSAEKKYDGTPLTQETVTVSGSGFVGTEGANYYNFASQTAVGSTANTYSYVTKSNTFADDYSITTKNGTLTVTQNDTLITIAAAVDSKMYDGSALTNTGYTVDASLLAAGDYFASVTVEGTITDAGTAANKVTGWVIKNQAGDDVTSFYSNIQTVDGTLEVTKRDITLTSETDTKPYDGTPLTNSTVTVSGDNWATNEGATYDVTGSQTAVGTSKNTFTYKLNDNTKEGNYNIHTVQGDLTVTPAELVITVGTNLYTGLSYLYDNTSTKVLEENNGYIVSGLAEGDKVVNVTITTNSANAGIYDENAYTLTYDVVNAAGESTKSSYDITENKNDVEITKRTITIEADSASKVYDGTALTCHTYTVTEGSTEETKLLAGEEVKGVGFTADSTITHVGSTANKVDATNVTITKADGSDSSMNYNILTEDGTLTVTARGVLLQSTSADKYYDGTALQNRQVVITGFYYDKNGNVVVDTEGGFLAGDGCTYDFVGDNVVIDKDGNIIAWTVSEQSDTAYGQTDVGTSKNEFNYNNFTSVKYGSYESDYIIMYGANQESLGLSKDSWDLYGDLTVWGGPVEINMTDYSWTYDYQAKTNGYFDDGYTVAVTTNEEGTEKVETEVAHNSEGKAIALLGNDTIVVNVTGQGGSVESGKVQHVGTDKQNTASYTIYRNGVDVTSEIEKFYQISIDGGKLSITPRTVELSSASDYKAYDGTALTNNIVIEGNEGRDKGFIFGEGAAYEVTGSQTEAGTSANTFEISKLLTDTKATDYNFVVTYGVLTVNEDGSVPVITISVNDYTKLYDGTNDISGVTFTTNAADILLAGDKLSITVSTDAVDAGTGTITVDSVKVMRGEQDVTDVYTFADVAYGNITINKRQVTLTSGSATKVYDGSALTNDTVTLSGDGFVGNEGAYCYVTGSQTLVGTSKNTFKYILSENTKAENYDITTVEGDLTVTKSEPTPTTDYLVVEEDMTLSAGYEYRSITVKDGATLTVAADIDTKKLSVAGANVAVTAGSLEVTGTATIAGTSTLTGVLDAAAVTISSKADVTADTLNSGKVTLSNNAKLTVTDSITGTTGADTVKLGSNAVLKAEVIDLDDGTNTMTVGSKSTATVETVSNVSKLTLSSGATMKVTEYTGTEAKDTMSIGSGAAFEAYKVDLDEGANAITLSGKADVKITELEGTLNKLTLSSGTAADATTFAADAITGTAANDTMSIGSYSDVKVDTFELGSGNDSIAVGKLSTFTAKTVDFGEGTCDKFTAGYQSTVIVDSVEGVNQFITQYGTAKSLTKVDVAEGIAFDTAAATGNKLTIAKYTDMNVQGLIDFNSAKTVVAVGNNSTVVLKSDDASTVSKFTIGSNTNAYLSSELAAKVTSTGVGSNVYDIGTNTVAVNFTDAGTEAADDASAVGTLADSYAGWLNDELDSVDFLKTGTDEMTVSFDDYTNFEVKVGTDWTAATSATLDVAADKEFGIRLADGKTGSFAYSVTKK